MTDRSNIFVLLDERPDLESAVEAVLKPEEPWSFDDVDVDSGAFGELVSHGPVETTDRRVATAALLMFALTPGHAFRTSLGFADHHAFDYVWLVVTALAVAALS